MSPAALRRRLTSATKVLVPSERAPGYARRFLGERFRELGIADDYVGRLVVTELVTNAYKHVGYGYIVVRVIAEGREVLVEVWDQGAGAPVVRGADCGAVGGRGLLLLAKLVREWGCRPLNEGGKVVWARWAP